MQERSIIKLLGPILALSGWWTACSSSGDPTQPEENFAEITEAEEAAGGAAEEPKVGAGGEESFVEENQAEGEEQLADGIDSEGTQSDADEDFIKAAADEADIAAEATAAAKKDAATNIVVDPTANPDPAFAAESAEADPTAAPPVDASADINDLAAAAAEAEAAVSSEVEPNAMNTSADIDPVGTGSDMTPPAFDGSVPAKTEEVAQSPMALAATPPAAAAPAAEAETLDASLAQLRWVGYRIDEKDRRLKVEVITKGEPEFEIYEETNRAQQLELVIRFYQTQLRKKIRRSIDSSEFRSPVALIRMREFQDKGVVDIVLTHRDPMVPDFVTKNGQMQLTYALPERYFDQNKPQARIIKERAESLLKTVALPLAPATMVARGQSKQVGYPQPGGLDIDGKAGSFPLREYLLKQSLQKIDKEGLPASFDRRLGGTAKRTSWKVERFSIMAVAQDSGASEPAEEEEAEVSNTVSDEEAAAAASQAEAIPVETVTNETFTNETEANAEENFVPSNAAPELPSVSSEGNPASVPAENAAQQNSSVQTLEPMESVPASEAAAPVPAVDPAASADAAQDVQGQSSGDQAPEFNGKSIFMEFYDAPLSVVLKSFSEETGNNFVYPATIGATPVTINFKGVPWDEALKAILETYSLGMVRIGQNVVRIDQVANLTTYLQALEQAHQFETRRLPTKVLVFRLNNAVANDVEARMTNLLGRDIQLDARIKVSKDDRTNSIVIEAPTHVLAKARNIIERLDLETPQVEIASRIVEVSKDNNSFFGVSWLNNFNFDPGRALGFGSLNFPNSLGSSFSVDPGVTGVTQAGQGRFRFGSLNKFVDLDLLLKMEEKKGTTNVLQSNRILVLDGKEAMILAGNSRFFRPAAGSAVVPGSTPGGAGATAASGSGLSEVKFNLLLRVTPQVTALGSVIMKLNITSDTPGDATGEVLANKNTRELETMMVRSNGDTGVIGGIYDTSRTTTVTGIPFLSDIPIIGALFRSNSYKESQTELLIMVTPTIISGLSKEAEAAEEATALSLQPSEPQALGPIKSERKKF